MRGRKTEKDWILRPRVPPLPLAREDEETFAFLLREDKKAFAHLLAELSRRVKEIEADAAKVAREGDREVWIRIEEKWRQATARLGYAFNLHFRNQRLSRNPSPRPPSRSSGQSVSAYANLAVATAVSVV